MNTLTNQSLNINLEVPALEVRISPILVQNYLRNTFFNQPIVLRPMEEIKGKPQYNFQKYSGSKKGNCFDNRRTWGLVLWRPFHKINRSMAAMLKKPLLPHQVPHLLQIVKLLAICLLVPILSHLKTWAWAFLSMESKPLLSDNLKEL